MAAGRAVAGNRGAPGVMRESRLLCFAEIPSGSFDDDMRWGSARVTDRLAVGDSDTLLEFRFTTDKLAPALPHTLALESLQSPPTAT